MQAWKLRPTLSVAALFICVEEFEKTSQTHMKVAKKHRGSVSISWRKGEKKIYNCNGKIQDVDGWYRTACAYPDI